MANEILQYISQRKKQLGDRKLYFILVDETVAHASDPVIQFLGFDPLGDSIGKYLDEEEAMLSRRFIESILSGASEKVIHVKNKAFKINLNSFRNLVDGKVISICLIDKIEALAS